MHGGDTSCNYYVPVCDADKLSLSIFKEHKSTDQVLAIVDELGKPKCDPAYKVHHDILAKL